MRGLIFVELVNMAEDAFGEDAVDDALDKANLDNDGAFTTVGNYPCSELVKLIAAFSEVSGHSTQSLQRKFGHWMIDHFSQHYPEFFKDKTNAFAILEAVDNEIHVEVKKLYPDAQLPNFVTKLITQNHLEMTYSSPRPLVELCQGMIEACLIHYDEVGKIERCPVLSKGNATKFDIRLAK